MHIPTLLPDELIGGYLERVARLNAMDGGSAVLTKLMAAPDRPRGRSACPTPLELASGLCGINRGSLVRAHSLLPLHWLVTPGRTSMPYCAGRSRCIERRHRRALLQTAVKRCPACVREDVQFWGFAYDRRSAQLPGVDWCAKHGVRLEPVWPLKTMPETLPCAISPAEQRYMDIFDALMDLHGSVPMTQACLRLRERSRALGLRKRSDHSDPALSDLVRTVMPADWLLRHHPSVVTGRMWEPMNQVCTYRVVSFTADLYVLALTALYPSLEEALGDFLRPMSPEEAERTIDVNQRWAAGQGRKQSRQEDTSELALVSAVNLLS